jgi:Cu(I)/Ag(I) efflux system membrane fusion protein
MTRARWVAAAPVLALLALVVVLRDDLVAALRPDPLAAGAVVRSEADGLVVRAALRPDPPRQRGDTLHLDVRRSDGAPVDGLDVTVEAMMPQMGAMPEMRSRATVTSAGPGRYDATFDLEMGGGWTLEVALAGAGADVDLRYGFTVGAPGLTDLGAGGGAEPTSRAVAMPSFAFEDVDVAALRRALDDYAAVRGALEADALDGVHERAAAIGAVLREVGDRSVGAPEAVRRQLRDGAAAADRLGGADTIEAARDAVAALSDALIALAAADPRLAEGRRVLACPMVPGTPQWIQEGEAVGNPYMGRQMPGCHVVGTWAPEAPPEAAATQGAVVRIDPVRRQRFGVTTTVAERRTLEQIVRAPGTVAVDERLRARVTTRTAGFVERLLVAQTGVTVTAGQPLLELYSPEIFTAEQELLLANQSEVGGDALRSASRLRLRLLGVADADLDQVVRSGVPQRRVTIRAPSTGVVLAKGVVEGDRVEPGAQLFEIAPLGTVWVEAAVYEQDLPLVELGLTAEVTSASLPGRVLDGRVIAFEPTVDATTRAATARLQVDDPDGALLPGAYVAVELRREVGPVVAVPDTAVVYAGTRRYLFVDLGEGRLQPRSIRIGRRAGGFVEVLDGVDEGEAVVTSGVFLVAAESRLQEALPGWESR